MQKLILIRQRGWSGQTVFKVSFFVFFDLFITRTGRTGGPILLPIIKSYNVFLRYDVSLGAFVDDSPFRGLKPQKGV